MIDFKTLGPIKTLAAILSPALFLASCKPEGRSITPEAPGHVEISAEKKPAPLPEKISFNEHIQPILSENCYHCHGPDSSTREPKSEPLRLDLSDMAFKPREDGNPVIAKGNPGASALVKYIRSTDPDVVMPPPNSHKKLTPRDIALIEKWVEQGAEYQRHWSFIPPARTDVPAGRNPIDHFIRERLVAENLKPNPPEEPGRFHRRLHFDLTGLPPSPEATEAFLQSIEKVPVSGIDSLIGELLSSPAAAEHQARYWLDAARYADTHGIHIDNYRAIWPYRDWVIDAFRKNMRWDQFTVEQIAGDLLPEPTLEQRIATGFNRCLATTGEGGAIPEEVEANNTKDRVETVSAVWLGLTTGCAACHDHKFDPVTTEDFYSLAAFFRNNTMNPMDGNNAEHPPAIFVPLPPDRARFAELAAEAGKLQAALDDRKSKSEPDFQTWLATAEIGTKTDHDASLALHIPFNSADSVVQGKFDGQPIQWEFSGDHRDGPLGPALLLANVSADLGDLGSFKRADKISYGANIYIEGTPAGSIISRMDATSQNRGWDLWIEDGKIAAHVIDNWPHAANKITSPQPLEPGKWHHVMFLFDGAQASHQSMQLFIDGKKVKAGSNPNTLGGDIVAKVPLRLGSRSGGSDKLTGTVAIQDFRFYRRNLSDAEIKTLAEQSKLRDFLATAPEKRTKEQTAALQDYFLTSADPATLDLLKKFEPVKKQQAEIRERGSMTLVMEEKKDTEATAHVLTRGVYTAKGKLVTANTPSALPPMPEGSPRNRLGLAKWLVDRDNPLTARVTVNRLWSQFFGSGLVESASDFGIMGSRPSHPQLLDWLAVEFMDSGWDFRHIIKLIVSSDTYRQSANVSPDALEKDPYNRLIARSPRHRLDAEVLRDFALSAAGLLSEKSGGPPVKPYQPEGIWESVAMPQSNTRSYKEDSGEALYRRSIYTFWKRTAPPPSMEILNAPSREVSCVRRDQTNTPLQALVMLNDPQFVEACRQIAGLALKNSSDHEARLDFITRHLLARKLDPAERKIVGDSIGKITAEFEKDPAAAKDLLTIGATRSDPALRQQELAAWTIIASQILNLDETLTR